MIIYSRTRVPSSGRLYAYTGKDLPSYTSSREEAYYLFGQKIEDKFGPEGATIADIYKGVSVPLGLTLDTTKELLERSVKEGYLK